MAIRVCPLEDIVPNAGVAALVDGEQVAIFRLDDDSVHAVGNNDPFSRANVLSRGIVGDLKGALVVASPVYKQHFDLRTGRCVEDASARIPVYAARVEEGWVVASHEAVSTCCTAGRLRRRGSTHRTGSSPSKATPTSANTAACCTKRRGAALSRRSLPAPAVTPRVNESDRRNQR